MFLRLLQEFSYIKWKLCINIFYVSSSYYKNSMFHLSFKIGLQMSSPALQAHLDQAG